MVIFQERQQSVYVDCDSAITKRPLSLCHHHNSHSPNIKQTKPKTLISSNKHKHICNIYIICTKLKKPITCFFSFSLCNQTSFNLSFVFVFFSLSKGEFSDLHVISNACIFTETKFLCHMWFVGDSTDLISSHLGLIDPMFFWSWVFKSFDFVWLHCG